MNDWFSNETHVLCNSKLGGQEQTIIKTALLQFSLKGHIWLASSGTTADSLSMVKWIALSKEAILHSADAVNKHIGANAYDVWINPLPIFHIGGLAIWARASLLGIPVYPLEKWDPKQFADVVEALGGTFASLVPTQVYDLVHYQLKAPPSLKGTIVGGGALSDLLYQRAGELGWRLLPSYGMTECSSQIATAVNAVDRRLAVLPHVHVRVDQEGRLAIQSRALCTGIAVSENGNYRFYDPKENGWYLTEDKCRVENGLLEVIGRGGEFVKIGGENVYLDRLQRVLDEIGLKHGSTVQVALFARENERLGHVVCAAYEERSECVERLLESYQSVVLPFERIREFYLVDRIPRSALGKVLKAELKNMVER